MRDDLSALLKKCQEKSTKIGSHIYAQPAVNRLGNSSSHQLNNSPIKIALFVERLTEAVKGGWYDKVQTVLNLTATSAAGKRITTLTLINWLITFGKVRTSDYDSCHQAIEKFITLFRIDGMTVRVLMLYPADYFHYTMDGNVTNMLIVLQPCK